MNRSKYGMTVATSALCLALTANLLDLLPNSSLTPLTWLMAGAVAGRLELVRVEEGETETEGAPDDMATLIADLTDGGLPEIAWQSVSSVTDVETVMLDSLSGDAEGLDPALSDASGKIGRIRAGVEASPTLRAAVEEAGYTPGDVIAAYGSSASEIALVIDTRG